MPFTLAHPAAILPLRGLRYLRTAPLIIGAMVPDTPYYLPGKLQHLLPEMHRFSASYTSCLALGYALLAALYLLRQPLTALLSARARWLYLSALTPFRHDALEWLFAAVAILLGAWTHLLWDSFTHQDGWMVRRVPALSTWVSVAGYDGPLAHLLQYLSSVLGLALLVVWYLRLPVPSEVRAQARGTTSSAGPVLLLIAAAAVLIGAVEATESFYRYGGIYRTLDVFLTHGLTWFALLYLFAGIIATLERSHDTHALRP
jgi:hypothetical protein